MPVWHAITRTAREAGLLEVVGIASEQHRERTRLFAQWHELDWPILWDPFDLTGSSAVPNHVLVDEHGIVRAVNPRREAFEELLFAEFPRPEGAPAQPPADPPAARLLELERHPEGSFEHAHHAALSDLLWRGSEHMDRALAALEEGARLRPEEPALAFRAGVARRLRYDSGLARPEDFQAALDHWTRALALEPGQYVWRRRIQQYGPRMDKPYNFYSWVARARAAIEARGEQPVRLTVALTPAELAEESPFREAPAAGPSGPDAEGVPRDARGLVGVETAVAFDTSRSEPVASVHLALRPDAGQRAHWNHEAGPLQVSIEAPPGWRLDARWLEDPPRGDVATSDEVRRLSFEVALPRGERAGVLSLTALYYVCEGPEGVCTYLRRDFAVVVERP